MTVRWSEGGLAFWLWAFAAMFANNSKMAPRIRYSRTSNSALTFAASVAGRLLHIRLEKLLHCVRFRGGSTSALPALPATLAYLAPL